MRILILPLHGYEISSHQLEYKIINVLIELWRPISTFQDESTLPLSPLNNIYGADKGESERELWRSVRIRKFWDGRVGCNSGYHIGRSQKSHTLVLGKLADLIERPCAPNARAINVHPDCCSGSQLYIHIMLDGWKIIQKTPTILPKNSANVISFTCCIVYAQSRPCSTTILSDINQFHWLMMQWIRGMFRIHAPPTPVRWVLVRAPELTRHIILSLLSFWWRDGPLRFNISLERAKKSFWKMGCL